MDNAPTVGGQSAKVVGDEILKYLDCHNTSRLLHVHALRAGDGLTIAKSLGHVHDHLHRADDELSVDSEEKFRESTHLFAGDVSILRSSEELQVDSSSRRGNGGAVVRVWCQLTIGGCSNP